MPTASPRLKSGKIYRYREWPEQYWGLGAVLGGRLCQRHIPDGGGKFARPYPGDGAVKGGGYWRWPHPWTWRARALFKAGVPKTLTVTCICTTDLAPRPAIRLLANPAIGVLEQVAAMPAGPGIERSLTLTATATATGVAWLQLEWLAAPDGRSQQDWCGWGTVAGVEG